MPNLDLTGIIKLARPKVPENTPNNIDDLRWLITNNISHFEEIWASGEENERMYVANNWTEQQESDIRGQDRIPYSFPLVASKFRQIEGLQTELRTSYRVDAITNPQNELKADIAETILRTSESRSKFKYIESEVFKSGAAMKYGAAKVTIDNDGVENRMNFKEVDYKNLIWDLSDYSFELDDALFVGEVEQRKIFEYEAEGYDTKNWNADNTSYFGRDLPVEFYGVSANGETDWNTIRVFNLYVKTIRKYWTVVVPDTAGLASQVGLTPPNLGSFSDKKEAEKLLARVRTAYILAGLPPEGWIVEHHKKVYDFYKFNFFEIMHYQAQDIETHPYSVYFSIKFKDKFISFYDFLKSPQLFYDRMFMQIDYSIGKDVKTVKQLWEGGLSDRETPESAVKKLDKTGETILTKTPAAVVQSVNTQGAKTEWLQINTLMTQIIEDVGGGAAFFGLSEGAESGKAIVAKQRLGKTMAQTLFDNLLRWKENLGKKALIYHSHYISNEQTLRVSGTDISQKAKEILERDGLFQKSMKTTSAGYLTINKEGSPQSFLTDDDLEVSITTAPLTENEKEARYTMMSESEQMDPYLAQSVTWQEIKISNMPNITEEMRDRLIEERQRQLEAQQEATEREEKRKDIELKIKMMDALNNAGNKSANTQIKANEADTKRIQAVTQAKSDKTENKVNLIEASKKAG